MPQTDKYNCLEMADYVCSFENYQNEVQNLFQNILQIKHFKLEKKNVSKNKKQHILTGQNLKRINEYYEEDFKLLEYPMYHTNVSIEKGKVHEHAR